MKKIDYLKYRKTARYCVRVILNGYFYYYKEVDEIKDGNFVEDFTFYFGDMLFSEVKKLDYFISDVIKNELIIRLKKNQKTKKDIHFSFDSDVYVFDILKGTCYDYTDLRKFSLKNPFKVSGLF